MHHLQKSQWIYQILIKESPQGKSPASRWTQKVMRPTRSTSFESFSVLKICSKVKTHRAGKSTWCKLIKPVRLGTVFRSRFKTGFKQPFHLSKHWRRQAKHKSETVNSFWTIKIVKNVIQFLIGFHAKILRLPIFLRSKQRLPQLPRRLASYISVQVTVQR